MKKNNNSSLSKYNDAHLTYWSFRIFSMRFFTHIMPPILKLCFFNISLRIVHYSSVMMCKNGHLHIFLRQYYYKFSCSNTLHIHFRYSMMKTKCSSLKRAESWLFLHKRSYTIFVFVVRRQTTKRKIVYDLL